jgi:hypothetical protein
MMLGGWTDKYLDTVELYNWETNKSCQFQNIPFGVTGSTGTFMDGYATFCGGQYLSTINWTDKPCYKYESSTGSWIPVCSFHD